MSEAQPESSQYIIHFHGEAKYIAIGDGASVQLSPPLVGVPFQAPPLPAHLIPRPDVSNALKARLLNDEAIAAGALVISAVHGLGGIGKTTLVAALAYDPDLQVRFPDGILWATLGGEPDILSLLVGWIQELGGYDFRPTVVESASSHLRTLLHDKACLLVVDDAWQSEHIRPFLGGRERCQVLVTTRDATLARKVGAFLYDLDVMTEAQALALFQARLGPLEGNREQAAALAKELGYLPLALELAATQVEAGIKWDELLDIFRRKLADLAALDLDEATFRNESLRLSFRLSLERLSSEHQEAFAWLGVLPEDVRLNPVMAATLWEQDEVDARKRLRYLREKALIRAIAEDQYTVHDLLHDEARLRLAEQIPWQEAHTALLVRYQMHSPNGLWHTVPGDGYIHEHLTWHLEQAEQLEAIHTLLREETPHGRNGWYEARERLGQTVGYIEDVARAWRQAKEQQLAGLETRYALITASLSGLSTGIPSTLLVALVKAGRWAPARALAFARQVPVTWRRAKALAALASFPPEGQQGMDLLEEALLVLPHIEDEWLRANVLRDMAPHLSEDFLEESLTAARGISSRDQAWLLAALASHLPEEDQRIQVHKEALAVLKGIEDEDARVWALEQSAPHLPDVLLEEAVFIAWALRDDGSRGRALRALAPYLKGNLLEKTLVVTRGIGNEWVQGLVLGALVPHLSEEVIWEALSIAQGMKDEWARARAVGMVAPYLSEEEKTNVLKDALVTMREIEDEDLRTWILVPVVPNLPKEEREHILGEILAGIPKMPDDWDQSWALRELAPHLPKNLLGEGLVSATEIKDEWGRALALGVLAAHLPEGFLQETLSAIQEIEDEWARYYTLAALAPHLTEDFFGEALSTAQRIGDKERRQETLAALQLPPVQEQETGLTWEAPATARERRNVGHGESKPGRTFNLGEGLLDDTLAAIRGIDDEWARASTLDALAPSLTEGLLRRALATVEEIEDIGAKARALATLAPHLPESEKINVTEEVLGMIPRIEDEERRVRVLVLVAPQLPKRQNAEVLEMGLDAACMLECKKARTQALEALIPLLLPLPPGALHHLWSETLPTLAARPRPDLLADLSTLAPLNIVLGGPRALAEITHAIEDVGRWWP